VGFKVMYRPEMLRFPVTSHGLFYLGHGAINIAIPTLFNNYFSEDKRTIWRELLWIVFLFAALTNIHAVLIFIESNLSVSESIKDSLSVNLRVGVFPIIIMLLMAMVRSLELKLQEQELYNSKYLDTSSQNRIITINGESESIKVALGDLYFIKSSNNYSEIHYLKDERLVKKILRVPISLIEKELDSEFLFRVHRSYLINFLNTKKVIGNSNSCAVLLKKGDLKIPVSRVKRSEMLTALDKLPIQTMV